MHQDDPDSPPARTKERESALRAEEHFQDKDRDPLQHLRQEAPAAIDPEVADRAETRRMWQQASKFGFIGIEFGIATTIGYLIGRWLDGKFDTTPWLSLFFALCGIAAATRDLIRMAGAAQREESRREQRNHQDL